MESCQKTTQRKLMWGGSKQARTLTEQREAALLSCTSVLCIDFSPRWKMALISYLGPVLGSISLSIDSKKVISLFWEIKVWGWNSKMCTLTPELWGLLASEVNKVCLSLYKIMTLSACLAEGTLPQTLLLSVSWVFFQHHQLLKK